MNQKINDAMVALAAVVEQEIGKGACVGVAICGPVTAGGKRTIFVADSFPDQDTRDVAGDCLKGSEGAPLPAATASRRVH